MVPANRGTGGKPATLSAIELASTAADYFPSRKPPHRDVLGLRAGLVCKEFYDELDYIDAVRYAIADFKEHGSEYYDYFSRH